MTSQITKTVERSTKVLTKPTGRPSVEARSDGQQVIIQPGQLLWKAALPQSPGGLNQAPSPMALLLSALAGGAVAFIKDTLAPQLGARVFNVSATASCEADYPGLPGTDGVEPDLSGMRIDLRIESSDGEEAVARLLDAWKERCPIYLALKKPVAVEVTASVIDWYSPN